MKEEMAAMLLTLLNEWVRDMHIFIYRQSYHHDLSDSIRLCGYGIWDHGIRTGVHGLLRVCNGTSQLYLKVFEAALVLFQLEGIKKSGWQPWEMKKWSICVT